MLPLKAVSLILDLSIVNLGLSSQRMRWQNRVLFWIWHNVAKALWLSPSALWNSVSTCAKSNSDCDTAHRVVTTKLGKLL